MNKIKRRIFVITVLFLSIVGAAPIFAQGTIFGEVTDANDGETLVGVSLLFVGTSQGTITDINGKYIKRNVAAGVYEMRISYVGYETKIIEFSIQEDERLELNIELTPVSITGEEVQVTAQAMGQVAAINQQRTSETILNVVSEEKIKELPDANAAESIGRLSGVSLIRSGGEASKVVLRGMSDKYLNVTVDGVRIPATDAQGRGLDLSTISQNSLSGIELYKSLTPDKDADAIAGSINLVTKKAPDKREFMVIARGGYNQIRDSFGQYDVNFKYGERFIDKTLGVQVNANFERKIRNNEQISIGYQNPLENLNYFINNLDLEYVNEDRTRSGFGLILDVNTPDKGNIKLNTLYNTTTRDFLTHTRNYPFGESVFYNYRDRERNIDVFSSALNGQNYLWGFDINWSASIARSQADFPYDYELNFLEPSIIGSAGMMNGIEEVKEGAQQLIPFAYNNFRAATLYDAVYRTQENKETELTTYLDLKREYNLSDKISGAFKFGGKYRTKDRSNTNGLIFAPYYLGFWRPYEELADGSIVDKDFNGSYFEDFYQFYVDNGSATLPSFQNFLSDDPQSKIILDDFNMNPLIQRDRVREWYDINRNGVSQLGSPEYNNDPTATARDFEITESITAAYFMNTMNIGTKLTTIFGARLEQENHDFNNKWSPRQIGGFPVPVGAVEDTSSTYTETVVLPHAHLNYSPFEFLTVRAAAYRALARPDFNMRLTSYFPWREYASGGDFILYLGNPNLRTAKAWNYEVNASFYGNEIGLFSVSAYYKEIEDMYHQLSGITTTGDSLLVSLGLDWDIPYRDNTAYSLTVPYNSNDISKVWGLEIDHQINFYWLPGLWKNIVLSYNASWVRSETPILGQRSDSVITVHPILGEIITTELVPEWSTQRLESQPEFFGNVSLGYDIAGFSGRVSVFHQGEYYRSYAPRGNNNRLVGEFTRVDLALNYRINELIRITGNINNITNVTEKDIQDNALVGYRVLRNAERYGLTFDFGIRLDF